MKLLGHMDVLQQVTTWRVLIVVSALLLGTALSALIGQSGLLAGYMTADLLLTVALRPTIARLGGRALPLHTTLAASWMTGVFFLAQLL